MAGGVVVDVGANVGALTVPLARRAGSDGIVVAIEPQPEVFQLLCTNVVLNGLRNVRTINASCGDQPGWMELARVNPQDELNVGGVRLAALLQPGGDRVRLELLDDLLSPPRLDLIKADVEGMESAVLRGAEMLIAEHRPVLYLEAHYPLESKALFDLVLGELGYKAFWHLPRLYRTDNHAGVAENPWNVSIVSMNVVAVPGEHSLPTVLSELRPVRSSGDHPRFWST